MTTPEFYEIRIKGRLRPEWSTWFDGMAVRAQPNGETTLSGIVTDQAALHGLLIKIRDLGLPLLSVNQADPNGQRTDGISAENRKERSPC